MIEFGEVKRRDTKTDRDRDRQTVLGQPGESEDDEAVELGESST